MAYNARLFCRVLTFVGLSYSCASYATIGKRLFLRSGAGEESSFLHLHLFLHLPTTVSAAYLLGITQPSQVVRDPLFGGLFENLVVLDLLKAKFNFQLRQDFYYIRDNSGIEVDLVLERNRKLNLLEIKGAMTPDDSFAANMAKMMKCTDDILSCNVVYAGEDWPLKGGGRFVNFMNAAQLARSFCR